MAIQPINYVPQGGFGGANRASVLNSAQGIAKNVASINQARKLKDYKVKLGQSVKSGQGFQDVLSEYPEFHAQTLAVHGFKSDEDLKSQKTRMIDLYGALKLGPEAAVTQLEKEQKIQTNSGDTTGAAKTGQVIAKLKEDPKFLGRLLESHATQFAGLFPDEGLKMAQGEKLRGASGESEKDRKVEMDKLEQRKNELAHRKTTVLTAEEQKQLKKDENQLRKDEAELKAKEFKFKQEGAVRELVDASSKVQNETTTSFNEMSGYLKEITGLSPESFGAGVFDKFMKGLQTTVSGEEWGEGGVKMTALRSLGKKIQINQAMMNRVAGSGAMSDFETKSLMQTTLPDGASKPVTVDWVTSRLNLLRSVYAMEAIKKAYYHKFRTTWPTGLDNQFIEVGGKRIPVGPKDDPQAIIWRLKTKVRDYAGGAVVPQGGGNAPPPGATVRTYDPSTGKIK